jgi:hypothetical protein
LDESRYPREIPARPREAGDEPARDGVSGCDHDDGDRAGRVLGGQGPWRRSGDDHVNLQTSELGRELGEPTKLALRKPILEGKILALDPAQVAEPLAKRLDDRYIRGSRDG